MDDQPRFYIPLDAPPLHCAKCDYDVRGLPTLICSECGSDLATVGTAERNRQISLKRSSLRAAIKRQSGSGWYLLVLPVLALVSGSSVVHVMDGPAWVEASVFLLILAAAIALAIWQYVVMKPQLQLARQNLIDFDRGPATQRVFVNFGP